MKVGIVDADLLDHGTRHPNLALMKISGYLKRYYKRAKLMNTVRLVLPGERLDVFDKLIISKVFSFSKLPSNLIFDHENAKAGRKLEDYTRGAPRVVYGGTGFNYSGTEFPPSLPMSIERTKPDYSLYAEFVDSEIRKGRKASRYGDYKLYSIGFTTRGCFRKCSFCVNRHYDHVMRWSKVKEFVSDDRPYIYLWDPFLELKDKDYCAIFHEQGLGKTKIAIDLILYWLTHRDIDTVMVVTKKQLVENWKNEFAFHTHIVPKILTTDRKGNFYVLNGLARVVLTNFETVSAERERIALYLKCRDVAIIIDESTKLKNPESKLTRDFIALSSLFKIRVIMTGTPVANRPYDIWSQIYFLDRGESLGKDFEQFKSHADLSNDLGSDSYSRRMFEETVASIYSKIAKFTVRETKKSSGIILPEKEYISVPAHFENEQHRMYHVSRSKPSAISMKSMIEVVGQLQKVIELLETDSGKAASVQFAHKVLNETEAFCDFTLVKERRKRIREFLNSLANLETDRSETYKRGTVDNIFPDVLLWRESLERVNLFARALFGDYRQEVEWDDVNGCTHLVDNNIGERLIREGMFDAIWMAGKMLSDMLDFYDENRMLEKDLDLIAEILDVVEDILDNSEEFWDEKLELVRLYESALNMLARQYVVRPNNMELRVDGRFQTHRKGKYNDEYLLDGALWQTPEMDEHEYVRRWRIMKDGETLYSSFWPL